MAVRGDVARVGVVVDACERGGVMECERLVSQVHRSVWLPRCLEECEREQHALGLSQRDFRVFFFLFASG